MLNKTLIFLLVALVAVVYAQSNYEILFNRPDITGLTGGGATNLDGVPTTGLAVGTCVFVYNGSESRLYRLTSGTDAENSPTLIRPDDFADPGNTKIWKVRLSSKPSELGFSDSNWIYRITDTADTTLQTGGRWGIARAGATMFGNADSTHVNLGVSCTTGATGQNYKYAAIGGGYYNAASGSFGSTVAGGHMNRVLLGMDATIGGGHQNADSADYTTIAGGAYNEATAKYGTVPGGQYVVARQYGQFAYGVGANSMPGDAQYSMYVPKVSSVNVTVTELYLDGATTRLIVEDGRTYTFDISVVGRSDTDQSAGYRFRGVIENQAGTTQFIGVPISEVLGEDVASWDCWIEADDAMDALRVRVLGSLGRVVRWVGVVHIVETNY